MSATTRLHTIRAMRCSCRGTPAAPAAARAMTMPRLSPGAASIRLYSAQLPQQAGRPAPGYRSHAGGQRRCESTRQFTPGDNARKHKAPPPPRRPTFGEVLRRLWRESMGTLSRAIRGENFRAIFRQHPGEMGLALVSLVVMAGVVVYTVRIYFTYFYSEQFTTLPEPVANAMRRALYYSNYAPDPKLALKYYREAIEKCVESGLDPFSDEFMGVRIQVAAWLEKIERHDAAIRTLASLLDECRRWVALAEEQGMKELEVIAPPPASPVKADDASPPTAVEEAPQKRETVWGKRNRILRRSIGISVKLGELYADPHVLEPELAHENLVWAVESGLREMRRRAVEGVKEDEGDWLNAEEMGGALEALGNSFLSKDQAHLAVPAFLQALQLCQDPCHSAVLMNNIAASFAQHPLHAPLIDNTGDMGSDGGGSGKVAALGDGHAKTSSASSKAAREPPAAVAQKATRATYLEYAGNWAGNAQRLATETGGDKRTPECDQACAVSLCNLGDVAKMLGDTAGARRRFDECLALSERIGFVDGVRQAKAGLRALEG